MACIKGTYLYDELKIYINKYGYKSYCKRDLKYAGEDEALNANLQEMYSGARKITIANTFIEFILECINCEIKEMADLEFWLNNCNISEVYYLLIEKIKIIVKEGLVKEEDLYKIGRRLSTESRKINEIKLGLTLLRLSNNHESKEIFKVFSIHNEYVFYCLEGIKEYSGANSFIFNLAKITKGYGKLMAISRLEPLTEEIKIWLIEYGSDNDFLEEEIINIILNKISIEWYVNNTKSSLRKFNILSKILTRIYKSKALKDNYYDYDLFYEFVMKFNIYGKKFKHVYALVAIINFIKNKNIEALIDGDLVYKEIIKETNILEESINIVFKDSRILNIVKEEIERESIENILEVAFVIEGRLTFEDLLPILQKEPFNMSIYRYVIKKGDKTSKEKIIKFIDSRECTEENGELKNSILKYMDIKDIVVEDLSKISVEPELNDIFLITTNIENIEYRNLNKIHNSIYTGALVYLIPEENNLDDDNAIKVITEDGLEIGYIDKNDNYILRRLLEAEKRLYGIIEEAEKEKNNLKVSVYLSKSDIENEINDILKMILVESTGLLN